MAPRIDEHDACVVREQRAHHLLGAFEATLLNELLVLAEDGVALLQVSLGHVVRAMSLLRLLRKRLIRPEHHRDAVVHARNDERRVLGLEAKDGVGAHTEAEHDGSARLVGCSNGDAQRLLEAVGAHVQLRLERLALDVVGSALGEFAEDGRAGNEREPARPVLDARIDAGSRVGHLLAAASQLTRPNSRLAATNASKFSGLESIGPSQPGHRMRPVGPTSRTRASI